MKKTVAFDWNGVLDEPPKSGSELRNQSRSGAHAAFPDDFCYDVTMRQGRRVYNQIDDWKAVGP